MWTIKSLLRAFITLTWAILFVFPLLSGCAQEEYHEHDDTLSGTWEYHGVYLDPDTNQFVDAHVHVKLTDDGNNVFLDHCLHDKAMSFSRAENTLTNQNGQSLEIIHADKITSLSVPTLAHLVKIDETHDLQDSGSLILQSEKLPPINLTNNVCAQRTYIENDETVLLHLSLPFKDTYLDMTVNIEDINRTTDNLVSASFYSPGFKEYYNLNGG